MQDAYLVNVLERTSQAEQKLSMLEGMISQRSIELSRLIDKQEKVSQDLKHFSRREVNEALERIRVVKQQHEEWERKNLERIRDVQAESLILQQEKTVVLQKQKKLLVLEGELKVEKQKLEGRQKQVEESVTQTRELLSAAQAQEYDADQKQKRIEQLLIDLSQEKQAWEEYQRKQRIVLQAQEEVYERERLITLNERRMLEAQAKRLKQWEEQLKDLAGQLLSAQKNIYGQRGTG